LVVVVGLAVAAVAVTGLTVQAVRGNGKVAVQRDARTIHDASLDNAFYHCLDVQTHSLVAPGEPVSLTAAPTLSDLGNLVTLVKAVGSWVAFADPPSDAAVRLSLRDGVSGGGTCLGTVVVATYPHPRHGVRVRVGTGSSVPGHGPPPAPPL
jgi:hypothetical protein